MFYKTMTYCPECEHPLEKKFLKDEGDIPYCSQCNSCVFSLSCKNFSPSNSLRLMLSFLAKGC